MMLELILTRIDERALVRHAGGLRFLVFDELHTCEPTTHRYYVSASASLSFRQHGPPVHRSDFWRLHTLSPRLERLPRPLSG